jgi:hypothetical protein
MPNGKKSYFIEKSLPRHQHRKFKQNQKIFKQKKRNKNKPEKAKG